MPETVYTTELDVPTPEVYIRIARAIRDAGCFFVDPATQGQGRLIHMRPSTDGKTVVHRITQAGEFARLVLGMGLIKLRQQYRGQDQPLPSMFCKPYLERIEHIESFTDLGLPEAHAIYQLPAVVLDGDRLVPAWTGLHSGSGILFSGEAYQPIRLASVDPTYPHLKEWLKGIEFTCKVQRGNLMGYIVAAFARPVCPQFPFLVLDATDRKQGKTTTASAIHYLLTKRPLNPMTHTGSEKEIETRIGGFCGKPGPNVIVIDNVRPKRGQGGAIRSQFFAAAATCATPTVRPNYGKNNVPVDYPVIMLTMNNASVESDLYDRALRVVLDGEAGRYFKPNPEVYVKEHREALVDECLHILCSMDLSKVHEPCTRFGTWERVAGQAAEALGLEHDFDPDVYDTPDAMVQELIHVVLDMRKAMDGDRCPSPAEIAGWAMVNQGSVPELFEAIRNSKRTSDVARGEFLLELMKKLNHRELYFRGDRVHFECSAREVYIGEGAP